MLLIQGFCPLLGHTEEHSQLLHKPTAQICRTEAELVGLNHRDMPCTMQSSITLFSGEYDQNICDSTTKNCTNCVLRLPSCIGSTDGPNPFPTRLWKKDYISCLLNRTMVISKCQEPQYFNPKLSKCMDHVPTGTVNEMLSTSNSLSEKDQKLSNYISW